MSNRWAKLKKRMVLSSVGSGFMLLHSIDQPFDITWLFLYGAIIFNFLILFLTKRREEHLLKAEKAVFATTYGIDAAFDVIVREAERWRRHSSRSRRWSPNPLKWRGPLFAVQREIRPKLYRVVDRNAGIITFELAPIGDAGTSVKVTYTPGAQTWVETVKAKLPKRFPLAS